MVFSYEVSGMFINNMRDFHSKYKGFSSKVYQINIESKRDFHRKYKGFS